VAYGLFEPWHLLSAVFNVYNYYYIFFLDHNGPVGTHHPYGIVWSLAVEEHYYFVYPFVCYVLMAQPRRMVRWLVLICAATLAWRFYLAYGVGLDALPAERIYKATDTRIDSIGFGALFALLRSEGSNALQESQESQWLRFVFGLALMLATLLVRNEEFRQSLRYSLQGLALYLMFDQLVVLPSNIAKALATAPLVWLGRISYSLYLWHWLVLIALERMAPKASPPGLLYLLMVCISLGVAQLSFQIIEQPMLRRGQQLLQRRAEMRQAHP
jgi:peptidoglycan/LPS O-acetylase OafA/YrhL